MKWRKWKKWKSGKVAEVEEVEEVEGVEEVMVAVRIFAMTKLLALAVLLLAAAVRPVYAQGAYVSASLTSDVLRLNSVEGARGFGSSGGEAIGFALRLGTELGSKWGVEVEFARPAEIESDVSPGIVPLAFDTTVSPTLPGTTTIPNSSVVFPPFAYRFRTSQRTTTISAGLWARQQLSRSVSLMYIGGAGFHRRTQDTSITFEPGPILAAMPTIFAPTLTSTIAYETGPFAGVEGRFKLTEHAHLVAGARLHGLNGGWLLRPSAGIGWNF